MSELARRAVIVLLSNSQGTSVGVQPDEAYPSLLGRILEPHADLHRLLVSGWTIREFITALEDNVLALRPDLVVLQLGIVECAQRILSSREKAIFRALPFGRRVTQLLHYHRAAVLRLRKQLGIAVRAMPPDEFRDAIAQASRMMAERDIHCLFVAIPTFSDAGAGLRHPLINEDIDEYNAILRDFRAITMDQEQLPYEDVFQAGSVHFNVTGHHRVATMLAEAIRHVFVRRGELASLAMYPNERSREDDDFK